jgi:hypothetical protein
MRSIGVDAKRLLHWRTEYIIRGSCIQYADNAEMDQGPQCFPHGQQRPVDYYATQASTGLLR